VHTYNPFNPKYLEWYSPFFDMEYTIQVCRGERVNYLSQNHKYVTSYLMN